MENVFAHSFRYKAFFNNFPSVALIFIQDQQYLQIYDNNERFRLQTL